MSIVGVITTREVLRHTSLIVREFGATAYLRCCAAILLRKRTTFLNCVCSSRVLIFSAWRIDTKLRM